MKAPCQICSERVVGCHSRCKKYIEFRQTLDAKNERSRWHEGDYVPIGELKEKTRVFLRKMLKTNKVRDAERGKT